MIAQQRQQQVAAALETIVGSEEDRFKAAASKIEDSAHRAIDEQDRQAREVGEQISQLVISSLDRRPDRGWLDPVRRGARAARGLPRAAPSHSCPHSVDQGRVRAAARDRQGPRRRSRRSPPPLSGAEPLTMKSVSHSEARWALLPEHVIRCNGHMVNDSYTWRQPALLAPSRLTWLETHAFDLGVGRRDLRVLPPA
jgi:hypothetical protein